MNKYSLLLILIFLVYLISGGCTNNNALKAQKINLTTDTIPPARNNMTWLRDMGICPDSVMSEDTILNAFPRKGIRLDSIQIRELIRDKITNRSFHAYKAIRLPYINKLSDSLLMAIIVYEYPDKDYIYMIIYKNSAITDILNLPVPEESGRDNIRSSVVINSDNKFTVTKCYLSKGRNNDGEYVFKTTCESTTFYSISPDGRIHKDDVWISQSCDG